MKEDKATYMQVEKDESFNELFRVFGNFCEAINKQLTQKYATQQEYIKQLEDALNDAIKYEEGCRKTMCDVNKEFDMPEPKELAWVTKAKAVFKQ